VVDVADLLGALPGDPHRFVAFVGVDSGQESEPLLVGQSLRPAAEQVPDAVQGVTGAAPMPVDLLLDPATDVVDGMPGQRDHVESIEDGGGVGEFVVDGVLVAVERVQGGTRGSTS